MYDDMEDEEDMDDMEEIMKGMEYEEDMEDDDMDDDEYGDDEDDDDYELEAEDGEDGEDDEEDEEDGMGRLEMEMMRLGIQSTVVSLDQVRKPTTLGSTLNFRACVVLGNSDGIAGYSVRKAPTVVEAIQRATRRAYRDIVFIDRHDDRTLCHEVTGTFNKCKVTIRPTGKGRSTRSGDVVGTVLDYFGIDDVTAKCHGQRNPHTVIKAAFDALAQHESAEEIAMRTGRSITQVRKVAYRRRL